LVVALGVVPSPIVVVAWFGRVTGERYPCEGCGCGCASARECWTACCCHTEHERLVWAIEHGVMPPADAVFSDEQWIAAANEVRAGSAHCALCVARIKDELSRGEATARDREGSGVSACGDGDCGVQCDVAGTSPSGPKAAGGACCSTSPARRGPSWPTPAMSALSCKGKNPLLIASLPPTPPCEAVVILTPEPAPFVPAWPDEVAYASRSLDVPAPPPRAF
jgi:hypothetical protein